MAASKLTFKNDGVAKTFLRGLGLKVVDIGWVFPKEIPDDYPLNPQIDKPLEVGFLDTGDFYFRNSTYPVIAGYHDQINSAYDEQFGAMV